MIMTKLVNSTRFITIEFTAIEYRTLNILLNDVLTMLPTADKDERLTVDDINLIKNLSEIEKEYIV